MLPRNFTIDYESALSGARRQSTASTALLLRDILPSLWRDVYLSTITHEPNLVRFRHRTFEYICDL